MAWDESGLLLTTILLFAGQFEHACVRGKVAARRGAARPAQIHKINHMYCTCQPA